MSRVNEIKTGGLIGDGLVCNANVNTEIVNIARAKTVGLDVLLDNNDAVGSIAVEVCNRIQVNGAGNWVAVELSNGATSVAVAAGVNTEVFYDLADLGAKFLKVAYTDTNSGASAADNLLTVYAHVKPC